ncbi:MAG: putative Ig domain-containing protein, partial [Synergistaceae bacterium]|nr:putative Ig domain-containing protein [Synergistaceae bacterium]
MSSEEGTPPEITTEFLPAFCAEIPQYSATLEAAESTSPIVWSLMIGNGSYSGNGISNLNINSESGVITCNVSSYVGVNSPLFSFTFQAENLYGITKKNIIIGVCSYRLLPSITTTTLNNAAVGKTYSSTISSQGAEYKKFELISGELPEGLQLSSKINTNGYGHIGQISGTPTKKGTYTFTIKASNYYGSDTKEFTIVVGELPVITTESLEDAYLNQSYSASLTVSGDTPITWDIINFADGLTLNSDGTITGIPTKLGVFYLNAKANNSIGSVSKRIAISVVAAPEITTNSLNQGIIGKNYNAVLAATGSTPITWTVTSGNFPAGLTLSTEGRISGIPTTAGTFTFTVQAANSYGNDSKEFTINIGEIPVITTVSLADAELNTSYSASLTATGATP